MTDKELLKLAAKAAGIKQHPDGGCEHLFWVSNKYVEWNPRADDGDALRLAVTLNLQPIFNDDLETLTIDFQVEPGPFNVLAERYENDKYAATRRAIVRAAAEIGKEMK